jgi:hypothetical protein
MINKTTSKQKDLFIIFCDVKKVRYFIKNRKYFKAFNKKYHNNANLIHIS